MQTKNIPPSLACRACQFGFQQRVAMLDHGILNVPLSKRGDIDKQIDRFKREQAIEKRNELNARKAEFDAKKAKAFELIANLSDDRAKELMTKHKLTRKQLDAELKSIARTNPGAFLKRGI